jgi:hypothetical protein
VRRVRDARVVIKPRFAAGGTGVVSGYSVALKPADYNPVHPICAAKSCAR